MKHSRYFSELAFSYDGEISDLLSDSEGKSMLDARLKEKRKELKSILPMIEFSPEMVLPVFYDAFTFPNRAAMLDAIRCEPDDEDFPDWSALASVVTLKPWANQLVDVVLTEGAGEQFLVTAACLEFIRQFDVSASPVADEDETDQENDAGDDDEQDLAQMGDDWMAEQGFDSLKS